MIKHLDHLHRAWDALTSVRGPFPTFMLATLLCVISMNTPVLAGTTLCIGTDSDDWQWLHPGPPESSHGHEMRVVRWIPERAEFVAMGDAVVLTTDGDTWTPGHRFAPWMVLDYVWNASAGVSGEFIAVAEDPTRYGGAILRSTDLSSWTTVETLDWLPSAIAWNGVRYVVVGNYGGTPLGNAVESTDGVTWNRTDTTSTVYLGDVTFANGRFVAVGQGGTVRTSVDGMTWSSPTVSPPNEQLTEVHWAGSMYVATGAFVDDLFTSPDGDSWSSTPLPADIQAMAVNGSTVYVIARGTLTDSWIYSSAVTDLANWSIAPALGRVDDLAFNGSNEVAVGLAGTQAKGSVGWNWTYSDDPLASEEFKHLVALDGITVASTDSGKILRSTDHGATWTETNSASGHIDYLRSNGDPSNPLFLIQKVGNTAPLTFSWETSSDGETWTPVTGLFGSNNLPPGAGGRFFRYTSGRDLYSSTDGITWDLFYDYSFPGTAFYYVARHAGLWIVYGDGGRIETSPDGVTWTPRTSTTSASFTGAKAALDGALYLATQDREILRSQDGLTWERVHVTDVSIRAMASDGERILVDVFGPDDIQSSDGESWSLVAAVPAGDLLTYDGTGWTNAGILGVTFSVPGLEWTPKFAKTIHNNLRAVSAMGDTVAIAGYDDLLTYDGGAGSRSGSDPWQRTFLDNVAGMNTIANDGVTFVAAGYRNGSSTSFTPNALFTSEDGLDWTERAPRPSYFENVVYGDFGFVTANQRGEIYQSDDGIDWTLRGDFPTIYFQIIAWTGERYVAIGTDGEVVTSLDGVFFEQEPQNIPLYGTPWQASAMAHRQDGAEALTVLVGDIGRTWISTDHGRTWAVGNSGAFFGNTGFSNVKLIGSEFVATRKGTISISTNGIDWTDHASLSGLWISDLAAVEIAGEDPAVWFVGHSGLVQKAPLDRTCDALAPPPPPVVPEIFSDGFESANLAAWE